MHRPGAAEGDEREVARVVAALDGDEPLRPGHVLVDDVEDALGRSMQVEAERVADLLHGRLRRLHVELDLAAEELRRQVPDDDVRVGDRRVGPTLPVAGRARVGARGLRPDAQRPGHLRHVGDRAAARADGADVQARDLHRDHLAGEAEAVRDLRLALDRRLAVLAERDVGRGPAHVEGQHVLVARPAGDVERARHAARGAGEDAVDRVLRRDGDAHEARVRAEDVEVAFDAELAQRALEVLEVGLDARPHVRVHAGRQGPLVLPELGQHVGRDRDGEAGVELVDDVPDLALVRRVRVGVDERDGERLDARSRPGRGRSRPPGRGRPARPARPGRSCAPSPRACPRAPRADPA